MSSVPIAFLVCITEVVKISSDYINEIKQVVSVNYIRKLISFMVYHQHFIGQNQFLELYFHTFLVTVPVGYICLASARLNCLLESLYVI